MYESLPESSTMTTHMVAGAAAGVMEHCVMYPVDCVKVTTCSRRVSRQPRSQMVTRCQSFENGGNRVKILT